MSVLRSIRHRPFLLLWAGQSVSRFGDSLHRFALVWWVLHSTGSGFAMSVVAICQALPMLLFLLVGGVVVDRWSRIHIMLSSDVFRGVLTTAIAVLATAGMLEVWQLYIAAAIFGFVDAFFQPAYAAATPAIARREDLSSANALTVLSWQFADIAGPAAGATIVYLAGTSSAFAIDAATFFISAACLLPLRRTTVTPEPSERRGWSELREGIAVVAREPWLSITIAMMSLVNAFDLAVFTVTLPYLIIEVWQLDASALGIVQSLAAVGAVIGAVMLGRRDRLHRRGLVWYGTVIGFGVCMVLFGLPITIAGIAAVALVRGIGFSVVSLVWTNTVQELVPGDKLGRVSSIDWLGSGLLMPIGFAVVGWATDHTRPASIFFVVGATTIALAMLALRHPRIRGLD